MFSCDGESADGAFLPKAGCLGPSECEQIINKDKVKTITPLKKSIYVPSCNEFVSQTGWSKHTSADKNTQ